METVNLRIGQLTFDHADDDAEGDVLCLHIGEPRPGDGEETPRAMSSRYAPGAQAIVGVTVVNARAGTERDGRLVITIP